MAEQTDRNGNEFGAFGNCIPAFFSCKTSDRVFFEFIQLVNNNNVSEKMPPDVPAPEPDTQNVEKERYIEQLDADAKKRLDYLLDQAEIFTHFLSNGNASKSTGDRRPTPK